MVSGKFSFREVNTFGFHQEKFKLKTSSRNQMTFNEENLIQNSHSRISYEIKPDFFSFKAKPDSRSWKGFPNINRSELGEFLIQPKVSRSDCHEMVMDRKGRMIIG